MHPTQAAPTPADQHEGDGPPGWQIGSVEVLAVLLLLVVSLQAPIGRAVSAPVVQNWMT
ncbi:MAG: hypothetical protein QOI74_2088, partial [Micromonosporaceae bacterium]|nr:hypothetical protein [Micromonosporaceae bacterium]